MIKNKGKTPSCFEKSEDNQSLGELLRLDVRESCHLYPCLIFLQCRVCLSQLSEAWITSQAGRCAGKGMRSASEARLLRGVSARDETTHKRGKEQRVARTEVIRLMTGNNDPMESHQHLPPHRA